jgi:hypothetical protein
VHETCHLTRHHVGISREIICRKGLCCFGITEDRSGVQPVGIALSSGTSAIDSYIVY